jgi:exodeoxyribonuclease V alpha subunit
MSAKKPTSSAPKKTPAQAGLELEADPLPTHALRVKGTVSRIRYGGEGGFTIMIADISSDEGSDDEATLVGSMPPLEKGDPFEAELLMQEHPEYGYQYKVVQLLLSNASELELSEAGMMAYLEAKVSGVGPKLAKRIVEYYGDQTFNLIETDPEQLMKVPGVTRGTLQKILSSWDERHGERRVLTALQGLGLTIHQAQKAMRHFGSSAPQALTDDLYALTEVEGIGFITADHLATSRGMSNSDPRRLTAAAVYALQQAQQSGGHSYLPLERVLRGVAYYTKIGLAAAHEALERAFELGRLKLEDERVYLPRVLRVEEKLADHILELLETPPKNPWLLSKKAVAGLNEEQARVLRLLADHRLVVLSGGPGTGKSYTTKAVVDLAESLGEEVALCAPTGKAARRLSEMTGRGAKTIHRLLSFSGQGFKYGALEPLSCNLVIVDEVSMCGDALLLNLLEALPAGGRVLLVGDADQLPPVDWGMPLVALTKVAATVRLQEIYRQAAGSPIIRAAHAIKNGTAPDFFSDERLSLVPLEAEGGAQRLARLVQQLGGPHKVQVLTPMRKGPLGVAMLNEVLQEMFNPGTSGTRVGDVLIREGDLVVQTKNDYNNEVFNGTLGMVLKQTGGKVQVDFEGNVVELSGPELWNLQLGYALTVHRAQGSEWPIVVGVLHDSHHNMLSKDLAYTALTRASQQFVAAGSLRAWEVASGRSREERLSYLLERIRQRLEQSSENNRKAMRQAWQSE